MVYLDVHSQGRTRGEAQRNLADVLEVLRESRSVPAAEARALETVIAKGDIELTGPLPFMLASTPAPAGAVISAA